ncbi:hypothetical protein ACFQ9X_10435 [Catenulispora yoronensis]
MKDTDCGHPATITELRGTAEQGRLVLAGVLDRLDGAFPRPPGGTGWDRARTWCRWAAAVPC